MSAQDIFCMKGQLVLVTGASSGLGAHFAEVLAGAGATVVLAARRLAALAAVRDRIVARGGAAHCVELDVTSAQGVRACFERIAQEWGTPRVIVNNAGVTVTRALLDQTEDDFDKVLDTNLKGNWLVATEAARRMAAAGVQGSIVNIASILGERVAAAVAPYAISKAAALQATKAMALELARFGIRVNALLPGYISTELNEEFLSSEAGEKLRSRIPGRQFGRPSDLDGPLLLLASQAGRAMSGACVAVDHGHLVSSL